MNRINSLIDDSTDARFNKLGTAGYLLTDELLAIKALSQNDHFSRFKQSWNDLEKDQYVKAGYRYRRYSVFDHSPVNGLSVRPREPHLQLLKYNPIYGGQKRYYSGLVDETINNPVLTAIIENILCIISPSPTPAWLIKAHQFRVLAPGQPTPERVHQDGVDYVFILLISRNKLSGGINKIYDLDNRLLVQQTLSESGDCILLDDKIVAHEVSPIFGPCTDAEPGVSASYRDVLVLTFEETQTSDS